MRLWSLHPVMLDRAGLVAGWREALLAQKVLDGRTVGYRNHPQLARFRSHGAPLAAIGFFLTELYRESVVRGYHFDETKILRPCDADIARIPVTQGQIDYEFAFLRKKLLGRAPEYVQRECWMTGEPMIHPLFVLVPGDIEPWEKTK